jgi:hypothetical protein
VTRAHPRPCGWCTWDLPELRAGLDAYNAWAAPAGRDHVSRQHLVRVFGELPPDRREALIVEAQAFPPPKPEPEPTPEPAPEPEPGAVEPEPEPAVEESVWS